MKALLEQPNGLARRVVSKAGGNPTVLLDATDAYIRRQPRVSGDSSQARSYISNSCSALGLRLSLLNNALGRALLFLSLQSWSLLPPMPIPLGL